MAPNSLNSHNGAGRKDELLPSGKASCWFLFMF